MPLLVLLLVLVLQPGRDQRRQLMGVLARARARARVQAREPVPTELLFRALPLHRAVGLGLGLGRLLLMGWRQWGLPKRALSLLPRAVAGSAGAILTGKEVVEEGVRSGSDEEDEDEDDDDDEDDDVGTSSVVHERFFLEFLYIIPCNSLSLRISLHLLHLISRPGRRRPNITSCRRQRQRQRHRRRRPVS